MKVTLAGAFGVIAGITGALLGRRYAGALLWWIFTSDVRSTR